jgi:hypothetical protein
MNAQSFGPIGQVAYLVEDIDSSIDALGALFRHRPLDDL